MYTAGSRNLDNWIDCMPSIHP